MKAGQEDLAMLVATEASGTDDSGLRLAEFKAMHQVTETLYCESREVCQGTKISGIRKENVKSRVPMTPLNDSLRYSLGDISEESCPSACCQHFSSTLEAIKLNGIHAYDVVNSSILMEQGDSRVTVDRKQESFSNCRC